MNRNWIGAAVALGIAVTGCARIDDALTGHAQPVAEAAGLGLSAEQVGRIMAASLLPDSALTAYWAGQIGLLWADYVVLATLYQDPDTTASLDFERLLEDQRHYAALAVLRYRDSVVLAHLEPTDEELRSYYETRQPFTRLNVRRIVIRVPSEAPDAARDSLYREALAIRDELVGGADFVSVARARSQEPLAARGQVLFYQGHEDFPDTADSVVFSLGPGELSPVIATEDRMIVYRIEQRRAPSFESARDQSQRLLLQEREAERRRVTLDSLIGNARRVVREGAVESARQLASDPTLGAPRVSPGARLVTWENGELTARDVMQLFQVRDDLRRRFANAGDDEIRDYLLQLAHDQILIEAAASTGMAPTEEERSTLSEALAYQVSRIARQVGLSHMLVLDPNYELQAESLRFVELVLNRSQVQPWLGDYRIVLEQEFPVHMHTRGAELAARQARARRAAEAQAPAPADSATSETPGHDGQPPVEEDAP